MADSEEKQETPKTGKLLSGKQWFAMAMVILGAVATGGINIGVREYYQADVRYEQGTWYYSGTRGIVSLRIKNYGAADAEKVKFTASFDGIIKGASVNDPTVECQFASTVTDPQGTKTTTGTIERLVPKQTAIVYFEVDRGSVDTVFKEGSCVRSMVYNGGHGKTGEPLFWKQPLGMLSLLVGIVGGVVAVVDTRRARRRGNIDMIACGGFPNVP